MYNKFSNQKNDKWNDFFKQDLDFPPYHLPNLRPQQKKQQKKHPILLLHRPCAETSCQPILHTLAPTCKPGNDAKHNEARGRNVYRRQLPNQTNKKLTNTKKTHIPTINVSKNDISEKNGCLSFLHFQSVELKRFEKKSLDRMFEKPCQHLFPCLGSQGGCKGKKTCLCALLPTESGLTVNDFTCWGGCSSILDGFLCLWGWIMTWSGLGVKNGNYLNQKRLSCAKKMFTKNFRYLKWRVSSTLFTAFLGMGFPLHKPYPYSLYRFSDSSILGTWNETFGEMCSFFWDEVEVLQVWCS